MFHFLLLVDIELGLLVWFHFQQFFNYFVAVIFIDGKKQSTFE